MWCLDFTQLFIKMEFTLTGRLLMDLQDCALGSKHTSQGRAIGLSACVRLGEWVTALMGWWPFKPSVLLPKPACWWLHFTVPLSQDCSRTHMQQDTDGCCLWESVWSSNNSQHPSEQSTLHSPHEVSLNPYEKGPRRNWLLCLIREGTEAQRL